MPGSEFPVYEIPDIRKVGIIICSDGHWPEAVRNLALNGAEVITGELRAAYLRALGDVWKEQYMQRMAFQKALKEKPPGKFTEVQKKWEAYYRKQNFSSLTAEHLRKMEK